MQRGEDTLELRIKGKDAGEMAEPPPARKLLPRRGVILSVADLDQILLPTCQL
jgi:hypothetical protein